MLRMVTTRNKEGPTAQEAATTHQKIGRGTPRANFCLAQGPSATPWSLHLARGTDAPLGRVSASLEDLTPPRQFSASLKAAPGPRCRTYSPDQSIKCFGTPRALGSKANPRHAGPLTPPGNHIQALFH
jgi:hypothetical protein